MTTTRVDPSQHATLESFLRVHDAYTEAWRDGLARADATGVVPYYQGLRSVQYARPGWDALQPVSRETSIEGVRQTIAALPGYRQVISDRTVLVRSEAEVVVFFRKSIESDERRFAAFMMQVWLRSPDDATAWTLVRETVEK